MTYVDKKQAGFTIIEMLLAMTFVATLLIGVSLAIIKIGTTYNRGITVTEVNQVGRELSTELSQAIRESSNFVFSPVVNSAMDPVGGRLCTGQFSYVWNYADALEKNDSAVIQYQGASPTDESKWIRMVKVSDPSRKYCVIDDTKPSKHAVERIAQSEVNANATEEIIRSGDRRLNVYDFQLDQVSSDAPSGQKLYKLDVTIGAGAAQSVLITDDVTQCRPPDDPLSDLDYCSVQQFRLVIRAGNGVN